MPEIAERREARSREAAELSRLAREKASLTKANGAQKEEIVALRKQQGPFAQEPTKSDKA
jgi:hypothetical protein